MAALSIDVAPAFRAAMLKTWQNRDWPKYHRAIEAFAGGITRQDHQNHRHEARFILTALDRHHGLGWPGSGDPPIDELDATSSSITASASSPASRTAQPLVGVRKGLQGFQVWC